MNVFLHFFIQVVMEKAKMYFESHEDVSVAAIAVKYFGTRDGEQRLNWRFQEMDVVDIKKQYTFPHYYVGGVFLRKRVLNELHFDETMNFWEDALAINQVIVSEGKYGLIQDGIKKSVIQRCYRPVMDSYLPTQGKSTIVLFLMCSTW